MKRITLFDLNKKGEDFLPGQGEAVVSRKLERDVPLKIPENPKPPDARMC